MGSAAVGCFLMRAQRLCAAIFVMFYVAATSIIHAAPEPKTKPTHSLGASSCTFIPFFLLTTGMPKFLYIAPFLLHRAIKPFLAAAIQPYSGYHNPNSIISLRILTGLPFKIRIFQTHRVCVYTPNNPGHGHSSLARFRISASQPTLCS